ncbi:uncharacterized protein VTP21DRAFT_8918 [Calcarisporiella thermophila]|uniref:uncharacterized protein n=1 Tax=Calcarisporiella thermophila TaxID=911321 RepID=UPI0037432CB7
MSLSPASQVPETPTLSNIITQTLPTASGSRCDRRALDFVAASHPPSPQKSQSFPPAPSPESGVNGDPSRAKGSRRFLSLLFCCSPRLLDKISPLQGRSGKRQTPTPLYIDATEEDEEEAGEAEEAGGEEEEEEEEEAVGANRRRNGATATRTLLGPVGEKDVGRKCLVLDLDETLVHSSFRPVPQADFIIPIEIDNTVHHFYVLKRPGVDEFLRRMGQLYEIVVFTASVAKYADPVLDRLDVGKVVRHRLFRESCIQLKGSYVKDLSQLGRDLRSIIILDNSPISYLLHPSNAVPVSSWFSDPHDSELCDMIPFLEDMARAEVEDVRIVLDGSIAKAASS